MSRHADMGMTITKEDIYMRRSLETGSTAHRATRGSTRASQGAEGVKKMNKRIYLMGRKERGNAEQA